MTATLPLAVTEPDVTDLRDRAATGTSAGRPTRAPGLWRRLGSDTLYALISLAVVPVWFVVVVAGVSAGLGTLVLGVGLVLMAATALGARAFAHLERQRMRRLLGHAAPSPEYARADPEDRLVRRVLVPLRDPQSWLDLLAGVVGFVTGVTAGAVVLGWWICVGGGLTYWFWQRWLPDDNEGLAQLIGLGDSRAAETWLNTALAVLALLLLPVVARAAALLHAGVLQPLLCGRAEVQAEVRRSEAGRAAAHRAEADSLRRLERDIHDGPQQRLVRLQMDLGRARRQLAHDPQGAEATIGAALEQARDAVEELRTLSRGIAPPLLADRGLAVALADLAERCTVPVQLRLDLPEDPGAVPLRARTAAYFVAAEALTNIAKHAEATRGSLAATVRDGVLLLRLEDDGAGGAHPAKGRGLAGLAQRLDGVDGELWIDSPAGGPSVVSARIPVPDHPAAG